MTNLTIPCHKYGSFQILESTILELLGCDKKEFLVAFHALNPSDQESFACDLYEILED